jgi:hypothetical protein
MVSSLVKTMKEAGAPQAAARGERVSPHRHSISRLEHGFGYMKFGLFLTNARLQLATFAGQRPVAASGKTLFSMTCNQTTIANDISSIGSAWVRSGPTGARVILESTSFMDNISDNPG